MEGSGGPTALESAPTASALDAYRRRAAGLVVSGAVLTLAGWAVSLTGWFRKPTATVGGLGLSMVMLGMVCLLHRIRMRRVLGERAWRPCGAVFLARSLHAPAVVLSDPYGKELLPLSVVAVRSRYRLAVPRADGTMWWAGDARRGGVIARPGGVGLIWVKPVRGARVRRRLVVRAEEAGLAGTVTGLPAEGATGGARSV